MQEMPTDPRRAMLTGKLTPVMWVSIVAMVLMLIVFPREEQLLG